MALEKDFSALIYDLFKDIGEEDATSIIQNLVENKQISKILESILENQKKFMENYANLSNKILFENNGILESAGLNIDIYMNLSREEQIQWSKRLNLMSIGKFNKSLQESGYNIDQIKSNSINAKDARNYLSTEELNTYISNYKNLFESMKTGYKTLISIGQELRSTQYFDYIIGFFKGQGLEHLLTLSESEMDIAMNNLEFFGLKIDDQSGGISLGFNNDINRSNLYNFMKGIMTANNSIYTDGHIYRDGKIISEQDLIQQFSFLHSANIISTSSGSRITQNPRLLELLVSEGIINGLQANALGYGMQLENLSFIAGSDIMNNGYESSVKGLKGGGNNASIVDLQSLVAGLRLLNSKSNIQNFVKSAFQNQYTAFENQSNWIQGPIQQQADEAVDQAQDKLIQETGEMEFTINISV